jgi:hypothetical protein
MENLKRLSVIALATAVGVGFAAEQSSAGIIVDTMNGTAFSPRDTTSSNEPTAQQTTLVQGFTITDTSSLSSAAIRGYSQGADLTIAITSMIGPGASGGDVLFEQVFSTDADGFGTSIRSFDLGGLALGAGDYFFALTSVDPEGFEWAKVDRTGSVNTNDRGSSTYLSGQSWYSQEYTFDTGDTAQIFTLEIDGTIVPAPGGIAMLLGVGVGFSVRRKRF